MKRMTYQWIDVITQNSDDGEGFVVQQDGRAGFELIFVDEREEVHVIFWAHRRADNHVILIDKFFKRTCLEKQKIR